MRDNLVAANNPRIAVWDVVFGFASWRLWLFLGFHDIRQRYRRSSFGPLWLALGLGVTIVGIGILYSQILKINAGNFIPFLAISLLIWTFLSTVINESTGIFLAGAGLMTSTRVPYTSFVLRGIVRNLVVAAHCSTPVLLTYLYFRFPVHLVAIAAIPGLFLIVANMYWMSLLIGIICLRYRDIGQIIIYATQLALFLTPIIWMPSQVRPGSPYLNYNPIFHLINLIRGPIFYGVFPTESWLVGIVMLVFGTVVSAAVLVQFRRYLVFWI